MRRIYRRRFMTARFWAAIGLLAAAVGVALRMTHVGEPPQGWSYALLRAANWAPAALLGLGAAWLACRQWNALAAFDVDLGRGRFRLELWRPFGRRRIEGELADIAGWRYAPGGRPAIRARLERPRVELAFEVAKGWRPAREWRRIAPGAIAAYERDIGETARD